MFCKTNVLFYNLKYFKFIFYVFKYVLNVIFISNVLLLIILDICIIIFKIGIRKQVKKMLSKNHTISSIFKKRKPFAIFFYYQTYFLFFLVLGNKKVLLKICTKYAPEVYMWHDLIKLISFLDM